MQYLYSILSSYSRRTPIYVTQHRAKIIYLIHPKAHKVWRICNIRQSLRRRADVLALIIRYSPSTTTTVNRIETCESISDAACAGNVLPAEAMALPSTRAHSHVKCAKHNYELSSNRHVVVGLNGLKGIRTCDWNSLTVFAWKCR